MIDGRAHPRYAVEIDAEIQLGEKVVPVRTRNVSRGGLAIEAGEALTVSSEVYMALALVFDQQTMSEPLAIRGRVVWCSPVAADRWQLGLTFIGLTGEDRQYLDMFLRYLDEGETLD